jgi:hypothetical protein
MQLIPLGQILPGATYATVSVPVLSSALLAAHPELANKDVNVVSIQFDPGSTGGGRIYICNSAAAPASNRSNVIYTIQSPGDSWPLVGHALNDVELGGLYIGADNADDYACGYVRRA